MWLKSIKGNKRNIYIILYFFIFLYSGISFYLMNLYTPFNGDDYGYAYIIGDQNHSPIKTFADVYTSQHNHYLQVNGRIIPHVLEQTFMGIFGKTIFNILNTIIYLYLIFFIHCLLKKKLSNKQNIILLLLICISSLYCFSYPGQTELWMDGSFNYMWPTFLSLFVVYLFQKKQNYKIYQNILLFIFSFIASCTHEGIVIPITGFLLFFLLFFQNFRYITNYIIAVGYTLGALVVSLSPGILRRLSTNELPTHGDPIWIIVSRFLNSITALQNVYIFWFTALLILIYLYNKTLRKLILHKYYFWIILWIFNTIFIFILGFGEERVTYTLSIFSFIISFLLLRDYLLRIKSSFLLSILSILFIVGNIYAITSCKHYHDYYQKYTQSIYENKDSEIIINMNPYERNSRFIFIDDVYDCKVFRNKYYKKENITVLDDSSYSLYKNPIKTYPIIASADSLNLYYDSIYNKHFIIVEHYINPKNVILIERHPINNSNLLKHQFIVRKILNTLDSGKSQLKYNSFPLHNQTLIHFKIPYYSKIIEMNINKNSYNFQLK